MAERAYNLEHPTTEGATKLNTGRATAEGLEQVESLSNRIAYSCRFKPSASKDPVNLEAMLQVGFKT